MHVYFHICDVSSVWDFMDYSQVTQMEGTLLPLLQGTQPYTHKAQADFSIHANIPNSYSYIAHTVPGRYL